MELNDIVIIKSATEECIAHKMSEIAKDGRFYATISGSDLILGGNTGKGLLNPFNTS